MYFKLQITMAYHSATTAIKMSQEGTAIRRLSRERTDRFGNFAIDLEQVFLVLNLIIMTSHTFMKNE